VALVPTLIALGIGIGLGLRWGGRLDLLATWRPPLWPLLVGGISLTILLDLLPWSGAFPAFLRIAAIAMMLAFAVINIRVGGMVLVVAGLGLNLLVTVFNWGTPVSGSALVSAGLATKAEVPNLVLTGGREVADSAVFGFLGGVIPLPWGQVVSLGDLMVLVGLVLVTASVVRRYEVIGSSPFGPVGGGPSRIGPRDYRDALDALGRGPAPRKGPGLHPSRMGNGRRATRSRRNPGTRPR